MKYFSEKLNVFFNTEAELLEAEHEAENEAKADELYDDINNILGFVCAYMAVKIEDTYGVEYKFDHSCIGDIVKRYIEGMRNYKEENNAYTEQCLEAWDEAWNGINDSCPCCGESECDCDECEVDTTEYCVGNTPASEYRPFYSFNIRNPIFQRFIHEYRNTASMKKLAEEFPTIADMFDRLESGND